jgi:hypothetical protein
MSRVKTCGDYGGNTKAGNPCKNEAGKETDHFGTGKCYLHGGCSKGQPLKHGRYAKSAHGRLGKKIQEHMLDPNPLDLRPELAVLRARISFTTDQMDETDSLPTAEQSESLLLIIGGVQKLADTISKIQTRTALTANESQYYAVRLADILTTEIHYIRKEAISDEDALRHVLSKLRSCIEIPRLTGEQALLGD